MVYSIVIFGNDILRQQATPVAAVTDEIRALVADMLETMYDAGGLGLAAQQIGRTERICVIDVPSKNEKESCREANSAIPMPLVLINPEIVSQIGKQRNDEGCLSFPEIGSPVTRANQVTVSYTDLSGGRQTIVAQGLLARAIQHEIDHLNGVLFIDKISTLQRLALAGALRRLRH